VGLLEVFSNYPANFSREHVEILRRLGELVELTYARGAAKTEASEEQTVGPISTAIVEDSLAEPRAIDWLRDSQEQTGERKFPFWAIPVALILILLSFRGWMFLHEPTEKASATPLQPASQTLDVTLSTTQKPPPTRNLTRHRASRPQPSDAQTGETPEVVVRSFEDESTAAHASGIPPADPEESSEPPQLPLVSSNSAVLSNLVARQATMPKAAMMVSQGVVRGAITHQVRPNYPIGALSHGLSGRVVLEATINENGSVDQVKAISGSPVLARAAIDAVRQWRYQPSLLNGTPVRVETEITVNFNKP
jgi:TonB family protein